MSTTPDTTHEVVPVRLLRMRAKAQGVASGFVAALMVLVATNWLVLKGGEEVGPHLSLLGQYFIGYRVTFVGSLIGAAYAFVTGFILGYMIAVIYNFFASRRESRRA